MELCLFPHQNNFMAGHKEMNKQVIALGLLLALAYVPQNLQIIIALIAGSVFISSIIEKNVVVEESAVSRKREHGTTEMAKDVPSRASEKFDDSKTALNHLKLALRSFDPHRVEQIACVLDDCIEEYLDALAGEPGPAADAYLSSHMLSREEINGLLIEASTTCDGSRTVTGHLDKAAAKIAALFQSFDRVLHLGGYRARAGPVPVIS